MRGNNRTPRSISPKGLKVRTYRTIQFLNRSLIESGLFASLTAARARRCGLDEQRSCSTIVDWGCSSAGRAPALQAGCQEFESPQLHQSLWACSSVG